MGKKNKTKTNKSKPVQPVVLKKPPEIELSSIRSWIFLAVCITAICLFPMLSNKFTNWDDEYYVVQNTLLRGPDWAGIFSKPIVSNYHPLTIITLAINYQLSQLGPFSYLLVNLLLHLINTALVFYFIWRITNKRTWVAFLTAIIFGIHPMHVESVAWISERKDVLYTLFFLLAMLQYWQYLENNSKRNYWFCLLLFLLSLLSKPAAIVFPLVLLLLDYWKGRKITRSVLIEKIPFFILAVIFAVITVKIQSKTAIAGLDFYPLWSRFFFACYVIMIYFARFFVPYPLSAFHPYPPPDNLGWPILLSPVFIVAVLVFLWFNRKNKTIVFGSLFFVVNLLLVLQIISIGGAIVAERYTYVPYIGLVLIAGMYLEKLVKTKTLKYLTTAVIIVAFGFLSFQRTKVWRDSDVLWTDVIKHYPDAALPRGNRSNHLIRLSNDPEYKAQSAAMLQKALEDCNVALKNKPNYGKCYENRQTIYLTRKEYSLALADANSLIKYEPNNRFGYYTKGVVYLHLKIPDSALQSFNKCLEIYPNTDEALNNRGTLMFNFYQQYDLAIADFTKAINITPNGNYYMNRSKCYFKKGDLEKARSDARVAIEKGEKIEEIYRQSLNL
jgi:hypothetical protein